MVRITGFHPVNRSSILRSVTKFNAIVAQLVEQEPAHGEGPNAAG